MDSSTFSLYAASCGMSTSVYSRLGTTAEDGTDADQITNYLNALAAAISPDAEDGSNPLSDKDFDQMQTVAALLSKLYALYKTTPPTSGPDAALYALMQENVTVGGKTESLASLFTSGQAADIQSLCTLLQNPIGSGFSNMNALQQVISIITNHIKVENPDGSYSVYTTNDKNYWFNNPDSPYQFEGTNASTFQADLRIWNTKIQELWGDYEDFTANGNTAAANGVLMSIAAMIQKIEQDASATGGPVTNGFSALLNSFLNQPMAGYSDSLMTIANQIASGNFSKVQEFIDMMTEKGTTNPANGSDLLSHFVNYLRDKMFP